MKKICKKIFIIIIILEIIASYLPAINYKVLADDETESNLSVDNEYTLQAVFEMFKQRAKDDFDFVD